MYSYKIAPKQLSDLWRARQYLGQGSIASQIRTAVNQYLKGLEAKIGCPISDAAEVIEQHEQESARK